MDVPHSLLNSSLNMLLEGGKVFLTLCSAAGLVRGCLCVVLVAWR